MNAKELSAIAARAFSSRYIDTIKFVDNIDMNKVTGDLLNAAKLCRTNLTVDLDTISKYSTYGEYGYFNDSRFDREYTLSLFQDKLKERVPGLHMTPIHCGLYISWEI